MFGSHGRRQEKVRERVAGLSECLLDVSTEVVLNKTSLCHQVPLCVMPARRWTQLFQLSNISKPPLSLTVAFLCFSQQKLSCSKLPARLTGSKLFVQPWRHNTPTSITC